MNIFDNKFSSAGLNFVIMAKCALLFVNIKHPLCFYYKGI